MKELLAVLDMDEDEQWNWLIINRESLGYMLFQDCLSGNSKRMALADLAFRLRDEVVKAGLSEQYADALWIIKRKQKWYMFGKFLCEAKSIDFIIAALIAKGAK